MNQYYFNLYYNIIFYLSSTKNYIKSQTILERKHCQKRQCPPSISYTKALFNSSVPESTNVPFFIIQICFPSAQQTVISPNSSYGIVISV